MCCEILQLPPGKLEGIPHQTLNPTTLVLDSTLQTRHTPTPLHVIRRLSRLWVLGRIAV